MSHGNGHDDPAARSRDALRRFRESVDLEEALADEEEITRISVHLDATHDEAPPKDTWGRIKWALGIVGTTLGTGVVIALAEHCGK